jgi:hypothetical protein
MKRTILTMTFAAGMLLSASAQHDVMVQEGRKWISEVEIMSEGTYICTEEIKGDTLINDVSYKKMYEDGKYECAIRQEGKKVFALFPNLEEILVYDFALNAGEEYNVSNDQQIKVVETDTIDVYGKRYKRQAIGYEEYIVEGIGCKYGPVNILQLDVISPRTQNVRECYDGDELIFTNKDFGKPSIAGIDEVSSSSAIASPKVYSSDGKELDGLTKGLNIVKSADGKTVKVIR